jgi:class 3 adenylate cyclase
MFVDMEGCTHLCQKLSLRAMNGVHEAYFSRYLDIIEVAGGAVTELLGDGLVALFQGPSLGKDSRQAILAALRIRAATQQLNATYRDRHDPIVVNIGLHAGTQLIGITVLCSRAGERWFYRAVGPVTNIAARLATQAEHGQILMTGDMAAWVGDACRLRLLGPRRLKNVHTAVDVVEAFPLAGRLESRRDTSQRRGRYG